MTTHKGLRDTLADSDEYYSDADSDYVTRRYQQYGETQSRKNNPVIARRHYEKG